MSQPTSVLNAISWKDLCPWLLLAKTISVAIRPSVVTIAFIGVLLTPLGWSASELVFEDGETIGTEIPLEQEDYWIKIRKQIPVSTFWEERFSTEKGVLGQGPWHVFSKFYDGHLKILDSQLNLRQYLYLFLGSVWMILIWSVLGCMICRIAATHFTRDERVGIFEAFGFARKRLFTLWTSSFVPLILIALFIIPFYFVGLLLKLNVLLFLISFVWCFVAMVGMFMAVLLIPLFFGWPLLWPAIATESADPFDAVSRSYSYPTQRPYHYVFYWIVILVIGFLASFVVSVLADKSIEFSKWGVSWGAGYERVATIESEINLLRSSPIPDSGATPSDSDAVPEGTMLTTGAKLILFWETAVRILTIGFGYGFFFVAMTGMYLLLRKDNDFMELDEVFIEEEEETIPLPQMQGTTPMVPKPLQDDPNEEKPSIAKPDSENASSGLEKESAGGDETTDAEEDDEQPRLEDE